MTKDKLRLEMRAKRRSLTKDERARMSAQITSRLYTIDAFNAANAVCVYMSAFNEPDTNKIIRYLRARGAEVTAPVTDTASGTLTILRAEPDSMKIGAYGIYEPAGAPPEKEPDVILVPGLAFGRRGSRTGFGKGFYDKLLASLHSVKIGLCYDFQLFGGIERAEHDINMDYIVTEKEIVEVR